MKIRIKDNAIRFRLTRSEVVEFCKNGCYESKTEFVEGTFSYGLRVCNDSKNLSAELKSQNITVSIPVKMVSGWDTNSQIGFQNSVSYVNGKSLHLLVEKDFTCLEHRDEDESDNYPNPKMVQ